MTTMLTGLGSARHQILMLAHCSPIKRRSFCAVSYAYTDLPAITSHHTNCIFVRLLLSNPTRSEVMKAAGVLPHLLCCCCCCSCCNLFRRAAHACFRLTLVVVLATAYLSFNEPCLIAAPIASGLHSGTSSRRLAAQSLFSVVCHGGVQERRIWHY